MHENSHIGYIYENSVEPLGIYDNNSNIYGQGQGELSKQ